MLGISLKQTHSVALVWFNCCLARAQKTISYRICGFDEIPKDALGSGSLKEMIGTSAHATDLGGGLEPFRYMMVFVPNCVAAEFKREAIRRAVLPK